jgi:hypothetical protein
MEYGAPGRGKTTLASRFPKPLFFALERGIPSGIEVTAVADVDSFEAVMTALREIYSDGAGDYQTIVFDTLDVLEAQLIEFVCAKYQWKNIEAPPFRKGWVSADDEWRRFIRAITAIRNKHNMTIVLVAHAAIERIDDPRAPSYTCYAPKLHRRARALVMDASDIVGFLAEDLRIVTDDSGFQERTRASATLDRFLFLQGRPAFFAKNRFAMPEKIAVPIDFDIATLSNHWTKGATHG